MDGSRCVRCQLSSVATCLSQVCFGAQVKFVPLDRNDENSVSVVLQHVDHCMQYGEDEEIDIPKEHDPDFDLDGGPGAEAGTEPGFMPPDYQPSDMLSSIAENT